ncbi:MAG: relaxase [Rhizobiaceae bacterium]|nr:relaxase [Rhizobiaceae bacterium]
MNDLDNDHIALHELRGFVGRDLHEALAEAHAISKGTKCEQYLFSLSLSPPKDADVGEQAFIDAIDKAEQALGLDDQPRAIVIHEKEGRRHAHAVWSRIDGKEMKAINLPHFKNRLMGLSRELYLEHGWDMPDGLRRDGGRSPLNFTLDEWQQAKRLKLNPREIKQSFQEAWQRSDNLESFEHALEERGYFLARGDRRGFVAVNIDGEVFPVPRMVGIKTKEVKAKLGDPDMLRSVEGTQAMIARKVTDKLREFINDVDRKHEKDFEPLEVKRDAMFTQHREERQRMLEGQKERWQAETRARALRLNTGLKGLWDKLRGQTAKIKHENQIEAWECAQRDQRQRHDMITAQMRDRRLLQTDIDALRRKHGHDRKLLMKEVQQATEYQERERDRDDAHELDLDRTRHIRRDLGL